MIEAVPNTDTNHVMQQIAQGQIAQAQLDALLPRIAAAKKLEEMLSAAATRAQECGIQKGWGTGDKILYLVEALVAAQVIQLQNAITDGEREAEQYSRMIAASVATPSPAPAPIRPPIKRSPRLPTGPPPSDRLKTTY